MPLNMESEGHEVKAYFPFTLNAVSQLIKRSSLEFLPVTAPPQAFQHSLPRITPTCWKNSQYKRKKKSWRNLVCATSYNIPSSFPNAEENKILFCCLCFSFLVLKFISISCLNGNLLLFYCNC